VKQGKAIREIEKYNGLFIFHQMNIIREYLYNIKEAVAGSLG
jgi:hypothetical protein